MVSTTEIFAAYNKNLDEIGGRKDVTVRLHIVPDAPVVDTSSHGLHMTLTYLGDPTGPETFEGVASLIPTLPNTPFRLRVKEHALFGPNNDIPVALLEFEHAGFLSLHREYGIAEPGMPSKIDTPNYHVTTKGVDLPVGTMLTGDKFEVKRLGRADPFISISF